MLFYKKLISWYLENKRAMPWRETTDPYKIWLSEIILQQTRVAQGLPYYLAFIEAYPTVFELASAEEDEVLKLWQGLGYYSRARNLHFTAKYVVNELNGVFPVDYRGLLTLKGIGDYTASAIASICYNEPTPVVDGNVYRVLSRFYGVDTPINTTKGVKEFKRLAKEVMDDNNPALYNQAIMEFGAIQCKPKSPDCSSCPIQEGCEAYRQSRIQELPVKEKKLKIKKRYFNYLVFLYKGQTLIKRRTKKGIWFNLYEFPLFETRFNIDRDKFRKELLDNNFISEFDDVRLYNDKPYIHKLSHQHLYTNFYIIIVEDLNLYITEDRVLTNQEDIKNYAVPVLIQNFINDFFD